MSADRGALFSSKPPPARARVQVTAADGVRLSAWRSGLERRGVTCLLLHGSGDGAYVWGPLAEELSSVCAVVALDFRGHGDSEASRSGLYGLSTHAQDVEHVVDQLGLDRIVLCGHSMGGQVAVRLCAGAFGRRVEGVVLVDICEQPNIEGSRQAERYLRQSLRHYESIEEYEAWLMRTRPLLSARIARELAEGALRAAQGGGYELKLDPRVVDAERHDRMPDWRRLFAAIISPTLLIRGVASAMVSAASASKTVSLLRHGQLLTLPHAGHAVMSDNPEALGKSVLAFVHQVIHGTAIDAVE